LCRTDVLLISITLTSKKIDDSKQTQAQIKYNYKKGGDYKKKELNDGVYLCN